jgi:hypothetical protein
MRSRFALAVAIGFALAASAPAHADWKRDYDRGVKAAESGNWAEAESAMRAALAEEAKPDARKRFQGVVYKVYVPHHYAGLAAYRQGDCARAMEYWSNSANAGVVSGIAALNAAQSRGIADCQQKLATATKPSVPVVATPPVASPPKPVVTKPADAVVSTPPKPPIVTPKPPVETPKPAVAPSAVPAPAALVQSLESFLAGRYPAVLQLDPAALGDARSKAQGFLLRAASRHTLAELAGNDARQLDQARQDVRAARAANASLSPDDAVFSPRFRAFWKATR